MYIYQCQYCRVRHITPIETSCPVNHVNHIHSWEMVSVKEDKDKGCGILLLGMVAMVFATITLPLWIALLGFAISKPKRYYAGIGSILALLYFIIDIQNKWITGFLFLGYTNSAGELVEGLIGAKHIIYVYAMNAIGIILGLVFIIQHLLQLDKENTFSVKSKQIATYVIIGLISTFAIYLGVSFLFNNAKETTQQKTIAQQETSSPQSGNSTSDIYITVTAEKAIKLRKTPSLDLEEINIIPTGTRLKLIEKTNQKDTFEGIESFWYKVQYANTIGYVFGGFTDADKRAVANNSSTSSTQKMLQNYFQEVENGTMRAENYFSPSVIQFIMVKNTTPQGVNQAFASNMEFVNQQNTITSDLTSLRQENGINYYAFWTSLRCLRRSLNKYQLCNTKIEVGIDQNTKICSYKEISVDNLRYVDANGNSSQNAPDYPGNSENYEREVPSGYAQAITESGCTIRSEPTVRSEQTDFVPRWEMMQVLAKTNNYQKIEDKSGYWYKISYNGKVGYCFGGFMKVNF